LTDAPPLAVYVHWPYCARICPYCDFNVVKARGGPEPEALGRAIVADLAAQASLIGPRRLTSIFLGGGTPSLMAPEQAAAIIDQARSLWPAADDLEITLEANPTDVEAGRFAAFAAAGINRLSLGLQSLDDAALAFLGRDHDAAQGRRAAETALATFARVSIDMIYARPGQGVQAWIDELADAVGLGAGHVSPYQLTIEAGTAFGQRAARGTLAVVDEDLAAALYEATQQVLEAAGFTAYEVSNHARGKADRSQHNLAYWRGWDYVGAGPGAHGRLTTTDGRMATEGARRAADYIARVAAAGAGFDSSTLLSPREAALERLVMGLRSDEGVDWPALAPLGLSRADPTVDGFVQGGWLIGDALRLRASAEGRRVLDHLTARLAVAGEALA
jgi:putative oxygen-independent coproporphyrinogen III oxidase